MSGNYAYVAARDDGTYIADISIRAEPEIVASISERSEDVTVAGNVFCVVGLSEGVWIYPTHCPATQAVLDPDLAPVFTSMRNTPNPFTALTSIQFALGADWPATLRVYDVSGRLVRSILEAEILASGAHEVSWDSRDDQGRRVPSGIYLYRLEAGSQVETRRMVLLK